MLKVKHEKSSIKASFYRFKVNKYVTYFNNAVINLAIKLMAEGDVCGAVLAIMQRVWHNTQPRGHKLICKM